MDFWRTLQTLLRTKESGHFVALLRTFWGLFEDFVDHLRALNQVTLLRTFEDLLWTPQMSSKGLPRSKVLKNSRKILKSPRNLFKKSSKGYQNVFKVLKGLRRFYKSPQNVLKMSSQVPQSSHSNVHFVHSSIHPGGWRQNDDKMVTKWW